MVLPVGVGLRIVSLFWPLLSTHPSVNPEKEVARPSLNCAALKAQERGLWKMWSGLAVLFSGVQCMDYCFLRYSRMPAHWLLKVVALPSWPCLIPNRAQCKPWHRAEEPGCNLGMPLSPRSISCPSFFLCPWPQASRAQCKAGAPLQPRCAGVRAVSICPLCPGDWGAGGSSISPSRACQLSEPGGSACEVSPRLPIAHEGGLSASPGHLRSPWSLGPTSVHVLSLRPDAALARELLSEARRGLDITGQDCPWGQLCFLWFGLDWLWNFRQTTSILCTFKFFPFLIF